MSNTWLDDKIAYLSALKNMNDAQRLLLELSQLNSRTEEQDKKLNTLIKAEKAQDRANKQKLAVRKLLNADKETERKARTKRLIEFGALFEIAGLDQRDPAELLGILIKTAEIVPDDPKWDKWREIGVECLNSRKTQKNAK